MDSTEAQTTAAEISNAASAPPAAPAKPERKGFDFVRHETVQGMRRDGIFTFLGDRFGGLQVKIRPFFEQPVVVKKEAAENAIRMQLGLDDSEPLPGDKGLEVNRAAVTMAITGARGDIKGTEAMLTVARKNGFLIDDEGWIALNGSESAENVRELFSIMMDASTHLLLTLVRASRGLHRVRDEEVAAVGEDFVYGLHVKADWAD